MHLNSELLFRKYALTCFKPGMKVLEIGPAGYPSDYQKIVNDTNIDWHALDIYTDFISNGANNPNFILSQDPYHFPIENETYDIVLNGQVLCNVQKIWIWYKELTRVLKRGGILITIAPVSWPNNLSPIDCWRVYPDGMKALNDDNDLVTELCLFDSLELEHFGYSKKYQKTPNFTVPDVSLTGYQSVFRRTTRVQILLNGFFSKIPLIRRFMFPVRIAYDTISIARKPL